MRAAIDRLVVTGREGLDALAGPGHADREWASIVVPAGDHGIIAIDGASAWASPNGWGWQPLPEPSDGSMVVFDAVVKGDHDRRGRCALSRDGTGPIARSWSPAPPGHDHPTSGPLARAHCRRRASDAGAHGQRG
jgi:hypothetical protein